MSGHTPGPWTVNGFGGDFVVIARLEPHGVAISARAQTPGPGDPIADAWLIAAAPELLEALKALLEASHHDCGVSEREHLYEHLAPASLAATDAIAKAEGR